MRTGRVPSLVASLLIAGALASVPRQALAVPAGMLAGVDVSNWQGSIDWPSVAADGVRFAILKATEGTGFVDKWYANNVAGATANGIAVGAYHFASPSSKPGDAAAEADHFVQVARNVAGDIVPALDIEHTGGLSTAELQDWVRAWLARVRAKLGVRPMIYSSPGFWRYSMGDTEWFADNGYVTLWVAHWGVSSPSVPANDWGGRGWTFWQWTDCWHVHGISGCVDGDRFNGTNLVGGEIAKLAVTRSGGGAVTGPRISCGDATTECSRLVGPNVALSLTAVPDADGVFMGWNGACANAGASAGCTIIVAGTRRTSGTFGFAIGVSKQGTGNGGVSASPAGVSCGRTCESVYPYGTAVTLTASPDSASGFGTWSGACNGSNPTCDVTITALTTVAARFDAAVRLAADGAGTAFTWGRKSDPRAIGRSYLVEHRAGASVSFSFTGRSVTWFTIRTPRMGMARVAIDGESQGAFGGYANAFHAGVEHKFTGLGSGPHVITVTALGTGPSRATGTSVAVDAIRVGGVLRSNPRPSAGSWSHQVAPDTSGYVVSDVAGAVASLRFTGTGVSWTTIIGKRMGRAEVWMDGTLARTLDLSATTTTYGITRGVSGLADRQHTIRLVVLGTRGAKGTGTGVAIEGWTVR